MLARDSGRGAAGARALDELGAFRARFALPKDGRSTLTYLCGHSLGLMPRTARPAVDAELARWAERGVEGHFGAGGWLDYHERFAAPLAALTGAYRDEVVAMNTLTVNLHLMLVSFFRPTKRRFKILIERDAFASDRYAVQSQLRFHGLDPRDALLELSPRRGSFELDFDRLEELLERDGERIALILLPGVQYLSGRATRHRRAHAPGATSRLRDRLRPRARDRQRAARAASRCTGLRGLVQLQVLERGTGRGRRLLRAPARRGRRAAAALRRAGGATTCSDAS